MSPSKVAWSELERAESVKEQVGKMERNTRQQYGVMSFAMQASCVRKKEKVHQRIGHCQVPGLTFFLEHSDERFFRMTGLILED